MSRPELKHLSLKIVSVVAALCVLTACGVSVHHNLTSEAEVFEKSPPVTIAVMPFSNATDRPEAGDIARERFYNAFSAISYRDVELSEVEEKLANLGAARNQNPLELSPDVVAEAMKSDALFYGQVSNLSKFWLLLYSHTKIDVTLTLYDARLKRVVWNDDATITNRWIATPFSIFGIIEAMGTTIWHLRDSEIEEAMTDGFQELVREAIPDPGLAGYEQSGEIRSLDVTIPRPLLGVGDQIAVELKGEASRKAYFDVGSVRRRIAMEEVDRGLYRGVYKVQLGDNSEFSVIRAYFLPEETKPPASKTQVRAVFAIDTTLPAPSAVTAYHFTADSILLSLKPVEGRDFEAYWIYRRDAKGEYWRLGKTEEPQFEDDSIKSGRTYSYLIRTRDRAGNETVSAQPFTVTVPQHGPTALPARMTGEVVLHAYSSPYRFNGEVTLSPDSTIRLDPGCILQATSKEGRIIVGGRLDARGTEKDEPVLMTGPQGWGGLVFDSNQTASLYSVTIEKAVRAFTLNKGEATLERCNLVTNGTAIQTEPGTSLNLRRTLISGNDTGALIRGAAATVEGCNFVNNRYGMQFATASAKIHDNSFASENLSLLYFSAEPVTLGPNCFNTVRPVDLARKIGGRILMTTVLDGAPPDGVETVIASTGEWESLTQQAEEAERKKDLRGARRALAKLRFLGVERDFFLRLSWLTEQIDGSDEALPMARSAAVAFPEDRSALYNYGRLLIDVGESGEAEMIIKRMHELFGTTSEEDALRRNLAKSPN